MVTLNYFLEQWNNEHHWKRAFTIKKLLLHYSFISTTPTLRIFVTKFQRTLKKNTELCYILHSHLFEYGSLLIGSILPWIYYIFIFYKFTKFWDLCLHFLYVIPTYMQAFHSWWSYLFYIHWKGFIHIQYTFNVKRKISILLQ